MYIPHVHYSTGEPFYKGHAWDKMTVLGMLHGSGLREGSRSRTQAGRKSSYIGSK